MIPLEPIPIPRRERWRAFVTDTLPALLFFGGIMVVAWLWQHAGVVPTLLAEAESIQAEVKSLRPGIVTGLKVVPLQSVAAGETIGFVHTAEPANAAAALTLIRAELDLLRATQEPMIDPARVDLERRRFELDWMRERVSLASLRGQLQQVDAELARVGPLHERQLVSQEAYDNSRALRDRLAAQLIVQEDLVARLAPAASRHGGTGDGGGESHADPLAAGIKVQEQKLRVIETQFAPVALVAPFDGIVLTINRREREAVVAGEPIVTIGAAEPTHLVGYLRQPLSTKPVPGSPVEVRTRGSPRSAVPATVLEVSRVLEPVPPTLLALVNRVGTAERGLRVHISVPPGLNVRPGEIVDVTLDSSP